MLADIYLAEMFNKRGAPTSPAGGKKSRTDKKTSTTTDLLRARRVAVDTSDIAAPATLPSNFARNARLKDIMKHPFHQRAWQAASKGKKEVELGDLMISNPQVDKPPDATHDDTPDESSATPPASGFVLTGSINLFGTGIIVQLKSWHGPPPPHVVIGKDLPVYQHAELDSILASDFIPLFAGTSMDDFEFDNVTFTFQNYDLCVILILL